MLRSWGTVSRFLEPMQIWPWSVPRYFVPESSCLPSFIGSFKYSIIFLLCSYKLYIIFCFIYCSKSIYHAFLIVIVCLQITYYYIVHFYLFPICSLPSFILLLHLSYFFIYCVFHSVFIIFTLSPLFHFKEIKICDE